MSPTFRGHDISRARNVNRLCRVCQLNCYKTVTIDWWSVCISQRVQLRSLMPVIQVWGSLNQFLPLRWFPNVSQLSKHWIPIEYHVHIWRMSPQLSCGDTRQIWKWFKELSRYICHIINVLNGEIKEWSFSYPHPRWLSVWQFWSDFVDCNRVADQQSHFRTAINSVCQCNPNDGVDMG